MRECCVREDKHPRIIVPSEPAAHQQQQQPHHPRETQTHDDDDYDVGAVGVIKPPGKTVCVSPAAGQCAAAASPASS